MRTMPEGLFDFSPFGVFFWSFSVTIQKSGRPEGANLNDIAVTYNAHIGINVQYQTRHLISRLRRQLPLKGKL